MCENKKTTSRVIFFVGAGGLEPSNLINVNDAL